MLASKLLSPIGNTDKLYVDDVFSAYTYTGNGSTQTINNGIDLAGKGGLVWLKRRDSGSSHNLYDTSRGATKYLATNTLYAQQTLANGLTAFNSSGFILGADGSFFANGSNSSYVSWTFRKAPKFFDVVTFTSTGIDTPVAHSLGAIPGMIIAKRTNATSDWHVWHRGGGTNDKAGLILNGTNAAYSQSYSGITYNAVTATNFKPGMLISAAGGDGFDRSGTYVAYLFAHDTTADGIVQCGSFTVPSNGTSPASVNLGWEPQWIFITRTNGIENRYLVDASRGLTSSGNPQILSANLSDAELSSALVNITATGFVVNQPSNLEAAGNCIYVAIRRPNKPPTSGTQVYNAVAYTGNSTGTTKQTIATGFPPDAVLIRAYRTDSGGATIFGDRLRGNGSRSNTYSTATETIGTARYNYSDNMQFVVGPDPEFNPGYAGGNCIASVFKRAPGFFDVVCRTGTGASTFTRVDVNHSLGVPPELIIYKCRSNAGNWIVGTFNPSNPTQVGYGQLNQTYAIGSSTFPGNFLYAAPTATQFSFWDPNSFDLDTSGRTYVAYLFASLPGISKVGSYAGNGSSQTINCGFSTGARFILIKRKDSAGDWYVWDTARGIVSANDPHLSLNTTAAEVTTNDSVDPDSTGFIVNQVAATNINVTSATYLYLAIA